jgi:hypothetical protein
MLPVAGSSSLSRPAMTEMQQPSLLTDARSSVWERCCLAGWLSDEFSLRLEGGHQLLQ